MVEDFEENRRKADEATRATIADNANMSVLLQHKRKMQAAGVGLKALRDSGLTAEEVHKLVDEVFTA